MTNSSGNGSRPPDVSCPAPDLLRAADLHAGYGKVIVVRNLDLSVTAGEIVVLLGANGAGKTTTLLTLAGWLRPLGGEVWWKGRPTTAPLHRRARMGLSLLTESRSVISKLTVEDNIRVGMGDANRAYELFPELAALSKRRAGLLSGGEQQMLGLARALSRRPEILLADELSLGLAPQITRRLLVALRQAADDGLGVLLVEQHAHLALRFADRGYVLRRGALQMEGSAGQLSSAFDEIRGAYLAR